MNEKLEAKLRKLLALAERGCGGEKDNASRMLQKLLIKNGLSIEDLAGQSTTLHGFKYKNKDHSKRILSGLMRSIVGDDLYTQRNLRNTLFANVTPSQIIEIDIGYTQYMAAFESEYEELMLAFIHKQKLYAPIEENDDQDEEIDPHEMARLKRIAQKMSMMGRVQVNLAISNDK